VKCQLWTFGEILLEKELLCLKKWSVSCWTFGEITRERLSYAWDSKCPLEDTINHYGFHLLHILTNVKVKKNKNRGSIRAYYTTRVWEPSPWCYFFQKSPHPLSSQKNMRCKPHLRCNHANYLKNHSMVFQKKLKLAISIVHP
jgi:hypothetical protein